MTDTGTDMSSAYYTLAIALVLGAVLLSASVYFSVSGLTDTIAKKSFTVSGGSGGTAAVAAAPSPAPAAAPAPSPAPSGAPVKVDISGRPVRGDANAKVTMVEFSDFQCPFCQSAEPTVQKVMSDYAGKVKLVYMHFPLSFHENAQKAAEASECANDQGKFWEYHDKLFDSKQLDVASLKSHAQTLGLDTAKFNACLDGGAKASLVSAQSQAGGNYGVSGTPTFFINGRAVVGAQPYSAFKTAIDAALAS